jgi:hypothetical protein
MENNNIIKQSDNENIVSTIEVTTAKVDNTSNDTKNKILEAIHNNYIKYKKYIFVACIVLIIFLLYKYGMLNYTFTVCSTNNDNFKDNLYNKNDSNKLITNGDSWNLENEIENIIKRQNIYIQEKKL